MPEPSALRLVFAGTPDFAARHLRALLDSPHEFIAVYTQPDRPAGRGKKLRASPVKQLAGEAGLKVFQPASLRDTTVQQELASLRADLLIVAAYGLILPQAVLEIPTFGCINVHASLLPRWRGAAPIQRAIEAGDRESGITIMQMDAGLDTGAVLASTSLPIAADMSAGKLHDALAERGVPLLLEVLDDLAGRLAQAQPQKDEDACYANKVEKTEAEVDWREDAATILRKILAFNPFPVAWTTVEGLRLKIWRVKRAEGAGSEGEILAADDAGLVIACGHGALCVTELQLPGGKPLATSEVLRSRRELFAVGRKLGA